MIAAQSSLSFATSMPKNTVIELPLVRRPLALINLVNAGLPVAGMTFDTVRSQLGRVVRPGAPSTSQTSVLSLVRAIPAPCCGNDPQRPSNTRSRPLSRSLSEVPGRVESASRSPEHNAAPIERSWMGQQRHRVRTSSPILAVPAHAQQDDLNREATALEQRQQDGSSGSRPFLTRQG
jgi:hypothetical protein